MESPVMRETIQDVKAKVVFVGPHKTASC